MLLFLTLPSTAGAERTIPENRTQPQPNRVGVSVPQVCSVHMRDVGAEGIPDRESFFVIDND